MTPVLPLVTLSFVGVGQSRWCKNGGTDLPPIMKFAPVYIYLLCHRIGPSVLSGSHCGKRVRVKTIWMDEKGKGKWYNFKFCFFF